MAKKLALVNDTIPGSQSGDATVDNKDGSTLVTFYADAALLAKIDEYRWTNRIEGRAKTVRELVIKATS
jgi:hypothetical protein